jgi:hypothetical protein
MKEMIINPFVDPETVRIAGYSDLIEDGEYSLPDFLQTCFERGWEGTALRVQGQVSAFHAHMKKSWEDYIEGGKK